MRFGFMLLLAALLGCNTTPIDLMIPAVEAGDSTLVNALSGGPCAGLPVQGVDACRVKIGSSIDTTWQLVVPASKRVKRGQVTVYWKDASKSYALTGNVTNVPLRDLIGHSTWARADRGIMTALAELEYEDSEGVMRVVRAEAMAVLMPLAASYDPLPFGSGLGAWGAKCEVEYSTAGRSALKCK